MVETFIGLLKDVIIFTKRIMLTGNQNQYIFMAHAPTLKMSVIIKVPRAIFAAAAVNFQRSSGHLNITEGDYALRIDVKGNLLPNRTFNTYENSIQSPRITMAATQLNIVSLITEVPAEIRFLDRVLVGPVCEQPGARSVGASRVTVDVERMTTIDVPVASTSATTGRSKGKERAMEETSRGSMSPSPAADSDCFFTLEGSQMTASQTSVGLSVRAVVKSKQKATREETVGEETEEEYGGLQAISVEASSKTLLDSFFTPETHTRRSQRQVAKWVISYKEELITSEEEEETQPTLTRKKSVRKMFLKRKCTAQEKSSEEESSVPSSQVFVVRKPKKRKVVIEALGHDDEESEEG